MNKLLLSLAIALWCAASSVSLIAQDGPREWTDLTGRFKVTGSLVEVSDGNVVLRRADGKLLKIPVTRLSKADQDFVNGGDNPFEMLDHASPEQAGVASSSGGSANSSSGGGDAGALWAAPQQVNWDQAEEFSTMAGVQWKLPPVEGELQFEAKRAPLSRKSNFHEHMHPIAVNTQSKRAVVGYTVSFAVPKPMSRLSLVDLATGKSVHSEPVEAQMRPLALLDNGNSIVMVGSGDGRGAGETKDQLQIWRFDGKKITRSASWIPYQNDKDGGRTNANVVAAQPISATKVMTLSDKGHIVLWDLAARRPLWHGRLSERNFAMQVSADRQLVAVFDEKTLMVLNAETAEILGSTALPPNTATGWVRVAWSPSGKQLLLTSISDIRVLDTETGQWVTEFSLPGGPVATRALRFPDPDYALLDNRLLVHLPTKIQVCEYRDAGAIETIGGTSFIALQGDGGGVLAASKFPHPAAEEMLQTAIDDPSVFLIHPGVSVSIDVSAVSGPHQAAARQGLEKSAAASGYKVDASSPIKIVGSISGPKQEAISYIAAGSYIVNRYTSTIKLQWNGKDLWTTSGTNVPGVLMTKRDQTMQQALDEAGKQPNTSIFASVRFPEFMQKPSEGKPGARPSSALMSSQFTMQGLVDSK